MIAFVLQAISFLAFANNLVDSFYLPGVAPHSYVTGEEVELKVNKLRLVLILQFLYIPNVF